MARRIRLPSAAELFGDPLQPAGRPVDEAPAPGRTAEKAPPRGRTPRRPGRAGPALVQRIIAVESRLSDLPIDSLIDLRDGLEALLARDGIDEAELALLLDPRPAGRR